MAVETSLNITATITPQIRPRFVAEEFATPHAVAQFLNKMAAENYRMVSITPISQTNHFNKDFECVVWVVMELDGMEHAPRS